MPLVLADEGRAELARWLEGGLPWLAERAGLSGSTIGRIWRKFDIKPHLSGTFEDRVGLAEFLTDLRAELSEAQSRAETIR